MTSMSKDTAMTASEEDRAQATEIVMCVMDAVRCSGGCEVSSLDRATVYAIEKKIATIRARAAAEATERAAKLLDKRAADFRAGLVTPIRGILATEIEQQAAAIRADLTAGQRETKREG